MNNISHIISFFDTNQRTTIVVCVAILIVLGLAYSIFLGDNLRYSDEREYFSIGRNLATKGVYSLDGVHPTAYRPPGYPLVLTLLMLFGSNIIILRFFNFVFLSCSAYFLHNLLREQFGSRPAIISVFLILCYPVLFYTAGTLYPQTFGSFLLVLFIYIVFRSDTLSYNQALLAGIILGYLILTIPTFIIVLVATLLFLIFRHRPLVLATPAVILLGASVIIAPWMARNWITFDSFIPLATNSGINLLLGNSPNTTANSGVNVDLSAYNVRTSSMSELERDNYYRSEAISFITANKSRALILYLQKLLNHFNYRNELATKAEASGFKDFVMLITFYPLLLIVGIRFAFFKRYHLSQIENYFIIVYVLNALFQAVFFTRIRFRLPFDFLLIAIVAIFAADVLRHHFGAGTAANKQNTDAPVVDREL